MCMCNADKENLYCTEEKIMDINDRKTLKGNAITTTCDDEELQINDVLSDSTHLAIFASSCFINF